MGNWNITIKGHGIHHNGRPDDADALARAFVKTLREKGHDVSAASFELTSSQKPDDLAASDVAAGVGG